MISKKFKIKYIKIKFLKRNYGVSKYNLLSMLNQVINLIKNYMKNIILVTGGAGFIGTNMISLLLKKTNYKIISLDNYSSGNKKIT